MKPSWVAFRFAGVRTFAAVSSPAYESIRSDTEGAAGIITISKPKALNALSSQASTLVGSHRHVLQKYTFQLSELMLWI